MSAQSPVTGSLFAPFFFPLGIAFMGAQSAVMMKMAGENWQYGKRRISAMTNEDFNKLTPLKLYQIETAELRAIIPSIESSLQSMTPLTATIVTEMINTFKVGAEAAAKYIQSFLDQFGETPLGHALIIAIRIWFPWVTPLLENLAGFVTPDEIQGPPEGSPPPPEGLPPPPPPEKPPNNTLEDYLALGISPRIVPTGTNRKQAASAVQKFEDLIREQNLKLNALKKQTTSASIAASISNVQKLISIYITSRNHFKKALSWLLRNPGFTTP